MTAKNLIIVESPAKAKTIHKILGPSYDVTSSMGHLRDLPHSRLGVDLEHDFEPHYIVIQKRRKFAKELRENARNRQAVYLAPDPDREGEAISWHLAQLLNEDEKSQAQKKKRQAEKKPKTPKSNSKKASNGAAQKSPQTRKLYRITFHEITESAVKAALKHPGTIDVKKVNAQQARRILDRLVGYSLSPLLWKKIGRGLSAGRVQSVALRLIVDREKEIEAFVSQEYWTIEAALQKASGGASFTAQLERIGEEKPQIPTQQEAEKLIDELRKQSYVVEDIEDKEQRHLPKPPFTTSTLQQEAFHKLGYSSARTMRIAQQLYEGLELGKGNPVGLITYMRTDSVRIADEAMKALRHFLQDEHGTDFLSEKTRLYKSKKGAQEAHEAIRPSSLSRSPESLKAYLNEEQFALYQLIWQRTLASQMADARDRVVSVRIAAGRYRLKAVGRTNIFAGWKTVYQETSENEQQPQQQDQQQEEKTLPVLSVGEPLTLLNVSPSEHFTKPPRRYTDASIVKTLEEQGIGRPSTYAPIIQTIVSRNYVSRTGGSLFPTELGRMVSDMLVEHFPEVMDVKFTAQMEEELDQVEEGSQEWVSVVRHFYTPFSQRVSIAQEQMREVKREVIPTEHRCDKCGKPMVIKWGRFGQFLSCSDYPNCKNAKPIPSGVACAQEGCNGELVERRAKGRTFYGCSNYPNCRYTTHRLPKTEGSDPSHPQKDPENPGVAPAQG